MMTNLTGTCQYSTMCGWCTKWDKKCDKKIGCDNDKSPRGLRSNIGVYDDYMDQPYRDALKKLRGAVGGGNFGNQNILPQNLCL